MPLQPVVRRSVPDEVFDQVLAEVVDGEIPVGDPLPSERRLAEVLGVSRPAVREALQRMAQTGLVQVRQGGATTVRNYRKYAGLDLLPHLLVRQGDLDPAVARSILEARLAVGPERRRAGRDPRRTRRWPRPDRDHRPARRHRRRRRRRRAQHALEFWDQVVDAADSLVFRLMFNSLRAAYEPALEALAPVMAEEVGQTGAYVLLTAAIAAGDPETARAAADRVLRPATQNLIDALAALEESMTKARPPRSRPWPPQRLADDESPVRAPAQPVARRGVVGVHPAPEPLDDRRVPARLGRGSRVVVGRRQRWWELLIPLGLVALFPVIEWVIHVAILHWRPRSLGPVTIDSLLARDHRAHHADPRDLPLVFIPWRALVWLLPPYVVVAWLFTPTTSARC